MFALSIYAITPNKEERKREHPPYVSSFSFLTIPTSPQLIFKTYPETLKFSGHLACPPYFICHKLYQSYFYNIIRHGKR